MKNYEKTSLNDSKVSELIPKLSFISANERGGAKTTSNPIKVLPITRDVRLSIRHWPELS